MTDHTTRPIPQEIPYGYCRCGCGNKTTVPAHTDRHAGMIKGEPMKYISGHNGRRYRSLKDLFYENITPGKPDECWEWPLACNEFGYGRVRYGKTEYRAHRLSYEVHYGPIPKNMVVCHRCDNPACCNPAHLFLGTHADNVDDMIAKGRNAKGERRSKKLTDANVMKIRQLLARGVQGKTIATLFGVSKTTISGIKHGTVWQHVR